MDGLNRGSYMHALQQLRDGKARKAQEMQRISQRVQSQIDGVNAQQAEQERKRHAYFERHQGTLNQLLHEARLLDVTPAMNMAHSHGKSDFNRIQQSIERVRQLRQELDLAREREAQMRAAASVRMRTYWALFALLLLALVGVASLGWLLLVIGVVVAVMQFGLPAAVYAFPRAFQRRRPVTYEGREYRPEELPPATDWSANPKADTASAVGWLLLTYFLTVVVVALGSIFTLTMAFITAVVAGLVAGNVLAEKLPASPRWNQAVTAGFTYAGRCAILAILVGAALQFAVAHELTQPLSVADMVAVVVALLWCAQARRKRLEQASAPLLPA